MVNLYVNRNGLLDKLKAKTNSQLEEIIFLFKCDQKHIKLNETTSQIAAAIIQLLEQQGNYANSSCLCLEQYLDGYPYHNLRNYLYDKEWQRADHETVKIMHLALKLKESEWMTKNHLDLFRENYSHHLILINNLWVEYSDKKFGFSIQKEIFSDCNKNWLEFGEKVGWYKQEKKDWMDYEDYKNGWKDAPEGYFPLDASISGENWDQYKDHFSHFMSILKPMDL